MTNTSPHFVLLTQACGDEEPGGWRFFLRNADGDGRLTASDQEPGVYGERLELLSVVRGLEAVPEPARVTLLTQSRYVSRMLSRGLDEWRENQWRWEHYGEWVPIKDADLWQRVDHALKFHQVECRRLRVDQPHTAPSDGRSRRLHRAQPTNRDCNSNAKDSPQPFLQKGLGTIPGGRTTHQTRRSRLGFKGRIAGLAARVAPFANPRVSLQSASVS